MRHKINEGDYTEWLLNQRDYEHELWNTDPAVREFDRQQRAYEQKIRKIQTSEGRNQGSE